LLIEKDATFLTLTSSYGKLNQENMYQTLSEACINYKSDNVNYRHISIYEWMNSLLKASSNTVRLPEYTAT